MNDNKLHKHLKKIVFQSPSRPVLQCVQYHPDGSLIATDAHVVLKINNFHELNNEKPILQNVKTMEFNTKDSYPDVDQILSKEDKPIEWIISLSALKRVVVALKGASFNDVLIVNLTENHAEFSNIDKNSDIPIKVSIPCKFEAEPLRVGYSATNLARMIDFMLDAKKRYATDDVKIYLNESNVRPALCEIQDGKYQFAVTPCRLG